MPEEARVERRVIWHPLQRGVGEDHVVSLGRFARGPGGDVGDLPINAGAALAGGGDHLAGTIDAGHLASGPMLAQDRGAVSGTATEVDNAGGDGEGNPCDQVAAGLGALFGEAEILGGVPGGHPMGISGRTRQGNPETFHGPEATMPALRRAARFLQSAAHRTPMDSFISPARLRHVIFTPPTRGRLRSSHAVFAPLELPDELSALPYDAETFLRSLFLQAELDVRSYRIETLKRRIPSCLRALRTPSLDKARWMIRQKPALLKVALNALLIGVTGFFRDAAVFEALRGALPELAATNRGRGRGLRIWSAACSEGAELYSVAMLLMELGLEPDVTDLLGTDCRTDAVNVARAGAYSADFVGDLPTNLLTRYFRREGLGYVVEDALRSLVRWRSGDALTLIEPGQWDVILCRNMAMYLRPEASRRLWGALEGALRPGGILVLGKAERPEGTRTLSPVGPCLFRRDRG